MKLEVEGMKLIVWLDIACPFCHIGMTNLDSALEELDADIEVEYKSFRLNPTALVYPGFTMIEELAEKYGKPEEEIFSMIDQVIAHGKEAGLTFNMDEVVPSNTMDAHRLIKFAAEEDKDGEVLDALYTAYFEAGRNIADQDVLLEIAESAALDTAEVKCMLGSDLLKELIYADQNEAKEIGVQGVPFIVINGEYAIAGARSAADYVNALEEAGAAMK